MALTSNILNASTPPLYITSGTEIEGDAIDPDTLLNLSGYVDDGPANWYVQFTQTDPPTGQVHEITLRAYYEEKISTIAHLVSDNTMQVIGETNMALEPPSIGRATQVGSENVTYMREYLIWSTQPLTGNERANLYSFSPTLPGMTALPGANNSNKAWEQIIHARSRVWVAPTTISPQVGFQSLLHESTWTNPEPFISKDLYFQRVIYIATNADFAYTSANMYLDIPACEETLSVVVDSKPEDVPYLTALQRSYQGPAKVE
jgi:hypothetical protein